MFTLIAVLLVLGFFGGVGSLARAAGKAVGALFGVGIWLFVSWFLLSVLGVGVGVWLVLNIIGLFGLIVNAIFN